MLYVVDDHERLPDFYRPDGNSYYISAAWPGTMLVGVLEHEIEHLRCECDFRNRPLTTVVRVDLALYSKSSI